MKRAESHYRNCAKRVKDRSQQSVRIAAVEVAPLSDLAYEHGMDVVWWLVAVVLMAIGLIGTVLPVLPGTTIILAAAIAHRIMVGPEKGMSWWAVAVLVALTLISYALEFASSYFGTKYFGATKWGVLGAIIGGIVGLFTGFVTLLILPIVGAIIGELIAGKELLHAGKAGWGALLGNLAGMIGKLIIGLAMVGWWLVAVPSPFAIWKS
jgi:uncharacterized protein YqgC (DUF456 family)